MTPENRSPVQPVYYTQTAAVRIENLYSPQDGGRNEANSWETGSEYSSGETYTAAAMRAGAGPGGRRPAGRRRPAGSRGLRARAGPARWDIPTS